MPVIFTCVRGWLRPVVYTSDISFALKQPFAALCSRTFLTYCSGFLFIGKKNTAVIVCNLINLDIDCSRFAVLLFYWVALGYA